MERDQILEELLEDIYRRYGFTEEEKSDFLSIAEPIFSHEEFKKRLDSNVFSHHDNVSLGEHILNDAALTYKMSADFSINRKLAVTIAMFHDLYELPWQNTKILKNDAFNRHGFRHPIESAINAATWFPDYFKDDINAKIIIDGIIHHMWPFPVRALNGTDAELNNKEKFDKLPKRIKDLIIESTLRNRLGKVSLSRSLYKEGRILSKADKRVSFKKDLSFKGAITSVKSNRRKLKKELKKQNKS